MNIRLEVQFIFTLIQYNRLIYGIEAETNKPYFISCIGHYKNLKEILKRVEDIELK